MRHPELTEQTIWEVFDEKQPKLVPLCRRVEQIQYGAGGGLEDLPGAL